MNTKWQIEHKDVMAWCAEYDGPKFHVMLCDPPYHLTQRQIGELGRPSWNRSTHQQRQSKTGFMGKQWDGGGIAFDPATWAALSEHLLPGAFIFVFGSSRGWHRLAVAIEDAGFIFHPSLMVWGWVNGAGFPKATRIDTQIDKAAGAEREQILVPTKRHNLPEQAGDIACGATGFTDISQPITPLAHAWEGHRYGRQALKPAVEMIICAQKPYEGKPFECIVETGAGALWVVGARVGSEHVVSNRWDDNMHPFGDGAGNTYTPHYSKGRWPPNFCLVHVPPHLCATCDGDGTTSLWTVAEPPTYCPLCGWEATEGRFDPPDAPGTLVNYSGYEVKCGPCQEHFEVENIKTEVKGQCNDCDGTGLVGGCWRVGTKRVRGDKRDGSIVDSPARSWANQSKAGIAHQGHANADGYEEIAAWECVEECAACRLGEQSGEGQSSLFNMKHPVNPNTSWEMSSQRYNPSGGYTDEGTAARFFPQFDWNAEVAERLMNSDQVNYCAKASRSERDAGLSGATIPKIVGIGEKLMICKKCGKGKISSDWCKCKEPEWAVNPVRNQHPTIKPIALAGWLATLLLPPPEYSPRRILIPFAGAMSEAIGAMLAGWEEILGIEMEKEYCEIGEARMKFWSQYESREDGLKAARQIKKQKERVEGLDNKVLSLW